MKIGIVIPLKSKAASKKWDTTCDSLEDTVRSIDNQTSNQFEAVIVGHDCPEFFLKNKHKVFFHTLETPPPDKNASEFTQDDYTLDKNKKIVRGMQLLKKKDITYWYTLDADDLLDRNFIEKISNMDCKSGCILDGGYIIYKKYKLVVPHDNLSLVCGSTSILSNKLFRIPDNLDYESMKKVPWCRYPHMDMDKYFEIELNKPYLHISDRFIGYVLGHGDNCSDGYRSNYYYRIKSFLKPFLIGRRLSKNIREKYSLME